MSVAFCFLWGLGVVFPVFVGDISFESADGDRLAFYTANTFRFALGLLRANTAADGRKRARLGDSFESALCVAFDDKRNEIRYLNIYRASLRAGASLTVKAPRSLFGGHFISVAKRDLVKVFISYVRILFYSRDFFIAHIRHLKYLPFAAGTDAPVMAPA
jgi:hypothetical protein